MHAPGHCEARFDGARPVPARPPPRGSAVRRSAALILALAAAATAAAPGAAPDRAVRVGVYDNPPKIMLDAKGEPTGFWAELTREIARREGWRIDWVMGTWPQGLERLEGNRIDVMVDVAITGPRRQRFTFSEQKVHISWSRIYAAPGTQIESIADLEGRRIGGLEDSFNLEGPNGLRALLASFDFDAALVTFPSYRAMFAALEGGRIDAGVTNKDFGNRMAPRHEIVRTPIMFQPAALHYAFASDAPLTPYLGERFDHHLAALKADPGSIYYQLQARWLGAESAPAATLPLWVVWTMTAVIALGLAGGGYVLWLELRMRARDRELRHEVETRERTQEALREREEHLHQYQRLLEASEEMCAIIDGDRRYVTVNPAFARAMDRSVDQLEGSEVAEVVGRAVFEDELKPRLDRCLAGEAQAFEREQDEASAAPGHFLVRLYPIESPLDGSRQAGMIVTDITERKRAEQELGRMAYEDRLTGLLSRNGFVHALTSLLETDGWQPDGEVIVLNLQGLRDLNEAHGYEAGDELLVQTAQRLREWAGEDALIGRTGADEFVVFLRHRPAGDNEISGPDLETVFDRRFRLQQTSFGASAWLGFTRLGTRERGAETLLREAGLAAQQSRRNRGLLEWSRYSEEMQADAQRRTRLTQELREALRNEEFELHFQPKVELRSGRLIACEALLRWRHPQEGLRSPGEFIPVAEQSQLIGPIGDWAVREACRHLREWQDQGLEIVRVAVNVSLVQFSTGDFVETVRDALDAAGIAADSLSLEITESVFEQASDALRRQLQALHDLGVQLSLDDFGTGYSSLLYLKEYPFDEIKVDQGFVRRMEEDSYSREIIATVLALSSALEAEVVAEGVETGSVREALSELGCRHGQGFYFSMPLQAEDFRWLLEQQTALPLATAS